MRIRQINANQINKCESNKIEKITTEASTNKLYLLSERPARCFDSAFEEAASEDSWGGNSPSPNAPRVAWQHAISPPLTQDNISAVSTNIHAPFRNSFRYQKRRKDAVQNHPHPNQPSCLPIPKSNTEKRR